MQPKQFPIQDGPSVPWSVMAPHEAMSQSNHGQSLKRVAERGGFWCAEAWCIVNGIPLHEIMHNDNRAAEFEAEWRKYARDLVENGEEVKRLKATIAERDAELETERMRVVACGVVALANTTDTVSDRIGKENPYWSACYGDVCDAVDREIELRTEVKRLKITIADRDAEVRRLRCALGVVSCTNDAIDKAGRLEWVAGYAREVLASKPH